LAVELSSLEKQLLQFIDKQFPLPWDHSAADEILTRDEKPLVTEADLAAAIPSTQYEEIAPALKRLLALQCVKKVYLYAPDDFSEVQVATGRTLRMPVAKAGGGVSGYQVTQLGKDTIAEVGKQPMADLEIFLSWSGNVSRHVADALSGWIPTVLPRAKTWLSAEDITKGKPWFAAIASQLSRSRVCLISVTPENVHSP
jgi:hypothetical protein